MRTIYTAQTATAALLGFGLLTAHSVADHWLQTDYQASTKGRKDAQGRAACFTHVAAYTATAMAFIVMLWAVFGLQLSLVGVLAGQAISASGHYWIDRRFTLERLSHRLGIGNFYNLGKPRDVKTYTVVRLSGETGTTLRKLLPDEPPDAISFDNPSLGTGAYALDQSWHIFFIFISTIVTVVLS